MHYWLYRAKILVKRGHIDITDIFRYELCAFPPRLFASEHMMLGADNKSQFLKNIQSLNAVESTDKPGQMYYVIDSGMLVQRIPWKVGLAILVIQ